MYVCIINYKNMSTDRILLENKKQESCSGDVTFNLFPELYGSYVQVNDRFESVHVWSEKLALINKGRWTPVLISKVKYDANVYVR